MSYTFTKLFSSITESTVWCENDRTRIAWICMLAMADRKGRVFASIPGLANRARIPIDDARKAVKTFLSPDPDSRTPEHEGRRIEAIDGGWRLLNHEKYRAIRDEETTRESKRRYINTRRQKERSVENVDRCRDNAEAEAYPEAEASKKPSLRSGIRPTKRCPADFYPSQELLAWAVTGAKGVEVLQETEKFRDYTFASPKTDWDATWRNWMRKASEKPNGSNGVHRGRQKPADVLAESIAHAFRPLPPSGQD